MIQEDFKKSNNYVIRRVCTLCGSNSLKNVLNFGKTPLANSFLSKINIKQKKSSTPPLEENYLIKKKQQKYQNSKV